MQWRKKWQNRPSWGKKCEKPCSVFGLQPSVSFCSASSSAKNFHFGASLLHYITYQLPCPDYSHCKGGNITPGNKSSDQLSQASDNREYNFNVLMMNQGVSDQSQYIKNKKLKAQTAQKVKEM